MAVSTIRTPSLSRRKSGHAAGKCSGILMAMKSGLTTEVTGRLRKATLAGLVMPCTLVLFAGCERQASNQAGKAPSNSGNQKVAATNQATTSPAAMVQIRGGKFVMGDNNEVDALPHEISVSSFLMDAHLVTQEQFQKVMGTNPSRWKGDKNPVEQLRWSDAVKFCNKRSESEGLQPCYDLNALKCNFEANGYRLPTEAEWEYACRAGTTTAFFFGDSPAKLGDYAWFDKNSGGHPRPVGQKQPNPWGLYDMVGNVWEWCHDFYQVDYYKESPRENPRGPTEGQNKVLRGGAWRFSAENCRSGYRYNESPGYSDVCFGYDIYGFRCVRKTVGTGQ
jgi:formylglycine-generating enzyme required for sulfatase activity